MLNFVKDELKKLNIDLVSSLSLDECIITRPYLLEKGGLESGSVIIFAVPYLSKDISEVKNISAYAIPYDYHIFFASLFDNLIPRLKEKYPSNKFLGFSDHSPIDERDAAAKAQLGIIGKNKLLITEKYSSYIFLAEIITDALLPSFANVISHCIDCGKCKLACPVRFDDERCLSSVTQRKGGLSEDEQALILSSGCAWGCDICQEVCPYTQNAKKDGTIYSSVPFFNENLISFPTSNQIGELCDEEFKKRAYSWRGKNTIIRNLRILEKEEL